MRLLFFITTAFLTLTALAVHSQTAQNESTEIISTNSVLINNKIPFLTTIKQLQDNLGKPDSIVTVTHDCAGYFSVGTAPVYFYGQTAFETNGDTAVLQKINFSDGQFKFKTNKITLNNKTTIENIRQLFPHCLNESNDWTNPIDKKTYRLVRISPQTGYSYDMWVLRFYNGQLIEIEYWIPC